MRTNKYELWSLEHPYMIRFRELNKTPNATYETYQKAIENEKPEICANVMICLINVVSYLLFQQIKHLENAYIEEGGIRERMLKARLDKRKEL